MPANESYTHLDDPTTIGDFTLVQWAVALVGAASAVLWIAYVSPFAWEITVFTGIYLAGLPALGAYLASVTEFNLVALAVDAVSWRLRPSRYLPGVGGRTHGYAVADPERDPQRAGP